MRVCGCVLVLATAGPASVKGGGDNNVESIAHGNLLALPGKRVSGNWRAAWPCRCPPGGAPLFSALVPIMARLFYSIFKIDGSADQA